MDQDRLVTDIVETKTRIFGFAGRWTNQLRISPSMVDPLCRWAKDRTGRSDLTSIGQLFGMRVIVDPQMKQYTALLEFEDDAERPPQPR